jgi:tRNA threonylcarbamoyladenosine biosynthesis protein TsaE
MMSLHAPILETRTLTWQDESECAAWTGALAAQQGLHGAVIELHGPLGAGKTTLVRHLLRALGVTGRIKSPTYAVLEQYSLPAMEVLHFDFYRFNDPCEWDEAGFRELFSQPGLKLCEWPERAAGRLPPADLSLHIEPLQGDARQVTVQARSARGLGLLP